MTFACRDGPAAPRGLCLAGSPACTASARGAGRPSWVRASPRSCPEPRRGPGWLPGPPRQPQAPASGSATCVAGLGVVTTFKDGGRVYVTHDLLRHGGDSFTAAWRLLASGSGGQGRPAPRALRAAGPGSQGRPRPAPGAVRTAGRPSLGRVGWRPAQAPLAARLPSESLCDANGSSSHMCALDKGLSRGLRPLQGRCLLGPTCAPGDGSAQLAWAATWTRVWRGRL